MLRFLKNLFMKKGIVSTNDFLCVLKGEKTTDTRFKYVIDKLLNYGSIYKVDKSINIHVRYANAINGRKIKNVILVELLNYDFDIIKTMLVFVNEYGLYYFPKTNEFKFSEYTKDGLISIDYINDITIDSFLDIYNTDDEVDLNLIASVVRERVLKNSNDYLYLLDILSHKFYNAIDEIDSEYILFFLRYKCVNPKSSNDKKFIVDVVTNEIEYYDNITYKFFMNIKFRNMIIKYGVYCNPHKC